MESTTTPTTPVLSSSSSSSSLSSVLDEILQEYLTVQQQQPPNNTSSSSSQNYDTVVSDNRLKERIQNEILSLSSSSLRTTTDTSSLRSWNDIYDYLVYYLFKLIDHNTTATTTTTRTNSSIHMNPTDSLQIIDVLLTINPIQHIKIISKIIRTKLQMIITKYQQFNGMVSLSETTNENDDVVMNDNNNNSSSPQTDLLPVHLIHILIEQMARSHDIEVSNNCTMSLVALVQYVLLTTTTTTQSSSLSSTTKEWILIIIQGIVQQWDIAQQQYEQKKLKLVESSTIIVRCGTTLIDILIATLSTIPLPEDTNEVTSSSSSSSSTKNIIYYVHNICQEHGVMDHLTIEVQNAKHDPLRALTFFDLIEKLVETIITVTTTTTTSSSSGSSLSSNSSFNLSVLTIIYEWLFHKDVLNSLLELAGGSEDTVTNEYYDPDPIVGGSALRIIGLYCRIGFFHLRTSTTGRQQQVNTTVTAPMDTDTSLTTTLINLPTAEIVTGFHRALHNFVDYSASEASTNDTIRFAILDALSSFATISSTTLNHILDDPITRDAWLAIQSVGQPKRKAAILVSIAHVLQYIAIPNTTNTNNNTNTNTTASAAFTAFGSIQRRIITTPSLTASDGMKLLTVFGQINSRGSSSSSTDLLLSYTKSPIVELRMASYVVLYHICIYLPTTGVRYLFSNADFYPFVIDRRESIETTKEGKEAKYAITVAIGTNNGILPLLANDIVQQITKYIQQGPYYIPIIPWDVATADM